VALLISACGESSDGADKDSGDNPPAGATTTQPSCAPGPAPSGMDLGDTPGDPGADCGDAPPSGAGGGELAPELDPMMFLPRGTNLGGAEPFGAPGDILAPAVPVPGE
jgi:hypothetical protein